MHLRKRLLCEKAKRQRDLEEVVEGADHDDTKGFIVYCVYFFYLQNNSR
jgi:hypothetical protein